MSIEYIVEDTKFSLSYKELKEHYTIFCEMSDQDFINNLPDAIHLACMICFLKEIPTYVCLSDKGVIHELAHLLKDNSVSALNEIRKSFREVLRLD